MFNRTINELANSEKKHLILYLIAISPLLLVLFMPLSGDLSIYLSGARTILEGKLLYKDFLDLKQPLFYFLYVPIEFISKGNEFIIRFFDFLIQSLAMFCLYSLISRTFDSRKLASLSVFLYSICYSVLGYTNSFHGESWFNLIFCVILYLLASEDKKSKFILIGILSGILISIKITFGIVFIIYIVYDLWDDGFQFKRQIKKYLLIGSISLVTFGISMSLILNNDVLTNYKEVMRYLKFYGSLPPLSAETIKDSIKSISIFFGDFYSLTLTLAVFAGIVKLFKDYSNFNSKMRKLVILFSISLIFLFLTVVIERKFAVFHFLRLYLLLSFFAAIGFKSLYSDFKKFEFANSIKRKFVIVTISLFIIVFSPVSRFMNYVPSVFYALFNTEKYDKYYTKAGDNIILRKVYKDIDNYFNQFSGKRVTVIANGANLINYNLKNNYHSKFTQSQFYFSKLYSSLWSNEFLEEVKTSDFLVIQTNDRHFVLTGHNDSSYERFTQDSALKHILDNDYSLTQEIEPFMIYTRKNQ